MVVNKLISEKGDMTVENLIREGLKKLAGGR